jgi:two-component system response regulator YesN
VDTFDKVKTAISLKAQNFLLKPINEQELEETLFSIAALLERRKQMERQMEVSMPILTQSFIQRLLTKSYKTEKEIMSAIEFFNLPLQNGDFMVLLIKMDDYNNKAYYQEVMEKELCKYGIFNISMELISNVYAAVGYYSSSDEIVIIVNSTDSTKSDVTMVYDICHEICHNTQKHMKTTVTIGAGRFYQGFHNIAKSYNEAVSAVEYRHIMGRNRIIPVQDINLRVDDGEINFNINDSETKLISELKLGLTDNAKTKLAEIEDTLLKKGTAISLAEIQIIAMVFWSASSRI